MANHAALLLILNQRNIRRERVFRDVTHPFDEYNDDEFYLHNKLISVSKSDQKCIKMLHLDSNIHNDGVAAHRDHEPNSVEYCCNV